MSVFHMAAKRKDSRGVYPFCEAEEITVEVEAETLDDAHTKLIELLGDQRPRFHWIVKLVKITSRCSSCEAVAS